MAVKMTTAFLDTKSVYYEITGEKNNFLKTCFRCENKGEMPVVIIFDEGDNTVVIATDAILQLDSCGETVYELIGRIVHIGDKTYPEFMKKIWG